MSDVPGVESATFSHDLRASQVAVRFESAATAQGYTYLWSERSERREMVLIRSELVGLGGTLRQLLVH